MTLQMLSILGTGSDTEKELRVPGEWVYAQMLREPYQCRGHEEAQFERLARSGWVFDDLTMSHVYMSRRKTTHSSQL